MRWLRWATLLCCWAACALAHAEGIERWPVIDGQDLKFDRLPADSGLSQTRAAQVLQDDRGFLWFGTQHGLSRYDGYGFKVYVNEPGKPDSLGGVFVYALFKDREGALWVGTDQSLDRYDAASETFRHHQLEAPQPAVIHISQDRSGMFWLSTAAGLIRFDPRTGAQRRYTHHDGVPGSLSSTDVKSSGEDRQGVFWVATAAGLDQFDPEEGTVRWHLPLPVAVREFSFHEDREGVFWVAFGTGNGLAILDRESRRLQRISFRDKESAADALTGVFALLEARDGTMWFATMGSGLLRLDRSGRRFVRYRWNPGQPDSIAENRAIALAQDREGALWVGLHALPPNRVMPEPSPFQSYLPGLAEPEGMAEHLVNSVFEDDEGHLWMGAGGALREWDRRHGTVRVHHLDGPERSLEVLAIADAGDGWLWVGTLGNGLFKFNRRSGAVRHLARDAHGLDSSTVTRLLKDRRGLWWLATWNGLWRFDPRDGSFRVYRREPGSGTEAYFSLAESPDGRLWLGSTTGLHRFDRATGSFETYRHVPGRSDTLSNDTVNAVLVDSAGTLWVATQNGLNRFDAQRGSFSRLFKADGLPGNAVSCILQDARQVLWVSTNEGLARFDPSRADMTRYTVADGLPGNDLTAWGACFRGPRGTLFFGGFAGAVAFDPDRVLRESQAPTVVLTELRLAGRVVQVGDGTPLRRSICFADPLVLDSAQNDLSLQMTALSFASPASNRYRYRREGLDENWHEGGPENRTVSFVGLPPGDYVLQMQGATRHGPWSEPGIRLPIRILAPWWRSAWFIGALVLVLSGLLWAAYRWRVLQIRRRYELRLEERLRERGRIARDLHDSLLQTLQTLLFQLQAVRNLLPTRAEAALQRLDRALDQGDLAVQEARNAVFGLRHGPEESDPAALLDGLWDELQASDERAAAIRMTVAVSGLPRPLPAGGCDEVRCIAREALRNVVNHAQAQQAWMQLVFEHDGLRLEIADDGVGIAADAVRPGHWGLGGMHERAREMGAELQVGPRAGGGTSVRLHLPMPTRGAS